MCILWPFSLIEIVSQTVGGSEDATIDKCEINYIMPVCIQTISTILVFPCYVIRFFSKIEIAQCECNSTSREYEFFRNDLYSDVFVKLIDMIMMRNFTVFNF